MISLGVDYREIQDFPGYLVGSDGSVWSKRNTKAWTQRKLSYSGKYLVVSLSNVERNVRSRTVDVHRIICEAFHGPCPAGMECRHLDGNKLNNRADNLTWGTHSQNQMDKHRHGTMTLGENSPVSVLTVDKVVELRRLLREGRTQKEVAAIIGVSKSAVKHVSKGRTWRHVPQPIPDDTPMLEVTE
jgi:DNA-binding XRE family transcriptional regulator